ncbi:MAG TPA: hypothetical protein VD866_01090 [Urbifossiella sp.]|nr:hypothetical protein [Urbifossiella sp.]
MDPEIVEAIGRVKAAAAEHDDTYVTVSADDLAALLVAAAPRLPKADRTTWATIAKAADKSQQRTADLHRTKHLAALLAAAGASAAPEPEPAG